MIICWPFFEYDWLVHLNWRRVTYPVTTTVIVVAVVVVVVNVTTEFLILALLNSLMLLMSGEMEMEMVVGIDSHCTPACLDPTACSFNIFFSNRYVEVLRHLSLSLSLFTPFFPYLQFFSTPRNTLLPCFVHR